MTRCQCQRSGSLSLSVVCETSCIVTTHTVRLSIHSIYTGALETDRTASSGRSQPHHTPSCQGSATTTPPSECGGRSSGTEGEKWALLLVCDLCCRVKQTALFSCCRSSLRISVHETHLVNRGLVWIQPPPLIGGGGDKRLDSRDREACFLFGLSSQVLNVTL